MNEKQLADEQSGVILRIERCIKRFEKLEKKLQQPWRNCDADTKKMTIDVIKKLNNILRDARIVGFLKEQEKLPLMMAKTLAYAIECQVKDQNMQKSLGEDITPFVNLGTGSV